MATFAALLAVVLTWGLVSQRLARYSITSLTALQADPVLLTRSLAVAAAATVFSAVTEHQRAAGLAAADALATGLARAALLLTIMSAAGVTLALLAGRHRPAKPGIVHLSAAAASATHTIPTAHPPLR